METGPVVVALVVVVAIGGAIAFRLRRSAARAGFGRDAPQAPSDPPGISTADQRFRLLSFQGGSVPADLGPVLEELRRNGIVVDEATLRRRLAGGATSMVDLSSDERPEPAADVEAGAGGGAGGRGAERPVGAAGTAIVLDATDVPGGDPGVPGAVRVQVTLELRIGDRPPVRAQRIAVVALEQRGFLTAGAAVPIRYDPGNPGAFALEWELA